MKKEGNSFNLSDRLRSFRFAFRGLRDLLENEHNFRIHIAVFIIVVMAGILLKISISEWLAIILVSALVLISESFNSSFEHLADMIKPDEDERIRKVKDIAAAAVLMSAFVAVITGCIIFIPYLVKIFA